MSFHDPDPNQFNSCFTDNPFELINSLLLLPTPSCTGGPSISLMFPLRNRGKTTCRNRWSPISKTCRNSALGRVRTKVGLRLEPRGRVVSSGCRFPNTRRQRTVGNWSAPFLAARRYVCRRRVSLLVRVRLCPWCTPSTSSLVPVLL